jgi:hypothetical protein
MREREKERGIEMLDKILANWAIIGQQMGKWSRLCSVPIYWGRIGSGGVSGPWPPSGVKRGNTLKRREKTG